MATYPGTITTEHPDVYASLEGETYAVHFPYSKAAVDLAKADLKAPVWDRNCRVWRVKRRWHKQLPGVLVSLAEIARGDVEMERAKREAEAVESKAADDAGRAALAAMKPFSGSIKVVIIRDKIAIHTAYHAEIVALFKSWGGRFDPDSREWKLPIRAGVDLAASREMLRQLHNAAVTQRQEKSQARAERRANSIMVRASEAPVIGTTVKFRDGWATVESHGKMFRADEDTASLGGPVGIEGEWVRYAYLRTATAEEIAVAEASEAKRLEESEQKRLRREAVSEAVTVIMETGERPDGWHEPEGEMIGRGPTAYGTGDWFVIGVDDIWYVRNNGMDGDDWSRNNVRTGGAGAIGYRVPYDPDLDAAIRWGYAQ